MDIKSPHIVRVYRVPKCNATMCLGIACAHVEHTEPCGAYYGTIASRATQCSLALRMAIISVISVPLWGGINNNTWICVKETLNNVIIESNHAKHKHSL